MPALNAWRASPRSVGGEGLPRPNVLRLGSVAPFIGVERVEGFSALRQGGEGYEFPSPHLSGAARAERTGETGGPPRVPLLASWAKSLANLEPTTKKIKRCMTRVRKGPASIGPLFQQHPMTAKRGLRPLGSEMPQS